jgi:hypothetical protein
LLVVVAAREARAKIIAAEGEQKASRALKVRFCYCKSTL